MHVISVQIDWLWLLENGFPTVGYHNGGLCLKDRNIVEGLFLKGDIQVLCTTNTLAHGINLPAHTVVIKSTQHLYVIFFLFMHFTVAYWKICFYKLVYWNIMDSNKEKCLYMEYDRSTILQVSFLRFIMIIVEDLTNV